MRLSLGNAALAALAGSHAAYALTVKNTLLVLTRDSHEGDIITKGLDGYSIPYQNVLVPKEGAALPALNATAEDGNFGGIIVLGEVSYDYDTGFQSGLTTDQWNQIYAYQDVFNVRLVRLDVFPGPQFGAAAAINNTGCCNAGVEQLISITDNTEFPTANVKTNEGVSTLGLWHYPAVIANQTIAKPIASFGPANGTQFTSNTVAAVINTIGGREQMAWFIGWAQDWSQTSTFLEHAYISWITRDDMHLETELYIPQGVNFRIRTSDLDAHAAWQADINTRLPPGSDYFLEVGHNGNGGIEASVVTDPDEEVCSPPYAVEYESPPDTALEFQKPLGTGISLWPDEFQYYDWSQECASRDTVTQWFVKNRDVFASVSHTFSHEELNNATYDDAYREIEFNIDWMKQLTLWNSPWFSPAGLIPPAITGLHNGDAIQAWMENGIKYVVGDNTRPVLRNQENPYWPLTTNKATNGYDGLIIIPRWATTIYYNCDTMECTLSEWIDTSGGSGSFSDLLDDARRTNTRNLLALHPDPYMFHQANLRQGDTARYTVGRLSGSLSLLQIWVETIVAEMMRLTNWPIRSLKHDDIAQLFINRQQRDACKPNLAWTYSADGKSIVSVTVTATGNTCPVPVPVTLPGGASTTSLGNTYEKIGSEPPIFWTTLSGSPVTYILDQPVKVKA